MVKVNFNGEMLFAQEGELLSTVLMQNGIPHAHPCGGRGVCKKCTVFVDGKEELSCRYTVEKDITVSASKDEIKSFAETEQASQPDGESCYVLDIGTTTLALALVSLDKKEIIRAVTRINPQCAYGTDVISRIDYCRKNSFELLQKVLINELNSMAMELGGIKAEKLYAAGNTTMLHLLLGADPSPMGVAPYTPGFLKSVEIEGQKLGAEFAQTVITLPGISAFVGADIVAGINFVGLPPEGKYSLLVDLGTNAEIVLLGRDKLLCASAAAGPCFEGANIECGMPAQKGAVYAYSKGEYKTVGDAPARGICGTGLVDIVSELLGGEIDETGYMERERFYITDIVYLSQADVRQFQLAKSAIYSALQVLIKFADIEWESIETLYISGGFSAELNPESAVRCGLIPIALKEKIVSLNNSSLHGALKYATEQNDLSEYTTKAQYIDLATNPDFTKSFMDNMLFKI